MPHNPIPIAVWKFDGTASKSTQDADYKVQVWSLHCHGIQVHFTEIIDEPPHNLTHAMIEKLTAAARATLGSTAYLLLAGRHNQQSPFIVMKDS